MMFTNVAEDEKEMEKREKEYGKGRPRELPGESVIVGEEEEDTQISDSRRARGRAGKSGIVPGGREGRRTITKLKEAGVGRTRECDEEGYGD
uniref:Uncharacterized protein n=1 Tax=Setaria digitata TaxID=48799 RepID=A0A915Q251_9BILA